MPVSVDRSSRRIVLLLIAYSVFHSASTAFCAYRSVYLQSIGMGAAQLGTVNALIYVAIFVFVSLSGTLSDKLGSIKKVLAPTIIITAILFTLVPVIGETGIPFVLFALFISIGAGFNSIVGSLTDTLRVGISAERGLSYGTIRSTGSVSYAVFSVMCIYLVPMLGAGSTYYAYALSLIPAFFILLTIPEHKHKAVVRSFNLKPLLGIREYWVFLIYMFVCYLAQKPYTDLMTVYMKELDINTDMYGLIMAMKAVFEVPALLLLSTLRKRISLQLLTVGSLTITALSAVVMGVFRTDLLDMIIIFSVAGFGNGLMLGTVNNYVYQVAPPELKATAVSGHVIVSSMAGLLGNLFGGVIMEKVGAMPFYLAIGIIILAASAVYMAFSLSSSRKNDPVR